MLVNISKAIIGCDIVKFNYKQLKQDRLCVYRIFNIYKIEDVFDVNGYDIFCKSKYESTDNEIVVNKFHFDVFKVYNSIENTIDNLEPSLGDKLKYTSKTYTYDIFASQEETLEALKAQMDNAITELIQKGWKLYEIEL